MFDFGIEGYQPRWLDDLAAVTATHGVRLGSLTGRTLTRTWLVWDLDADEWWADGPVLLDFGGEQVEINHQKFGELSITWNSVDPARPVTWPTSDGFRLAWRDDRPPESVGLQGQALRSMELLQWAGDDMAAGTVAVYFGLTNGNLTVYNALDENGLEFHEPTHSWKRHLLG